jgi:hypothetical protein
LFKKDVIFLPLFCLTNLAQVKNGGGEGEPVSVSEPQDEQGGAAGRHEDLHQATLPEEEED